MATEFEHESFARQQDSVHKRIEESLAKLLAAVTGAQAKEPPDPVVTPTQGWSLPPSITKAPLGVRPKSIPWIRLEPPRFDGENARDWIRKIQEYYNYHYTPLDDRLYLIQYLLDHPASDWLAYWMDNNSGKGWDDFLFAVKQRFDPDPLADYAWPVRKAHTSTSDLLTWSEAPSPAVSSTANVVRADQPVVEVCKVLIDGHITGEGVEILYKKKPCSGYSPKEMNDSGEGSTESRAYEDNFKCRTSVDIVKRAPIIAGDGGNPCLLQKHKFGGDDGARIFDPGVFKGVETIQVTYSVVESGVDASHCGDTVPDATEVVAMFRILLYSMVANQSFVNIRVFDFANFGEKFGTAEMLKFMFLIHDPP